MSHYPLRIKSIANGNEFGCQKIHVNGAPPLGGNLECPEMFDLPAADDRMFEVIPLGFKIRITNYNRENKQPSFLVVP